MRVLLISTYDLGRQPFGLASPAAWLRREGVGVDCVDTSRDPLADDTIVGASIVAFYLPMHTATRLAAPLIDRVQAVNPAAQLVAYGLYAPLNADWLRSRGVTTVLGPEAEEDLVALAVGEPDKARPTIPRLRFIQPDRSTLLPLQRYAALQMPDGTRRVVGTTEATRGCKHLCRHCPIVPVYRGAFRVVADDVVLADVAAQVAAGAQHISFGDPDFFNGPTHARRIVERMAAAHPGLSYDVTIKIEHLLKHADMLPLLGDTGCLFVTSAVESIDPQVLRHLRKGHTREDFVRAVALCRQAGVRLSPTFVPFTPWTTTAGYVELLDQLALLGLEEDVAPIQLAIRLLVTADSALLELDEIRAGVEPFDAASLTWPWRHRDAAVDQLQADVMRVVGSMKGAPRRDVFDAIDGLVRGDSHPRRRFGGGGDSTIPHLTEAWYCCAEPGPDVSSYV
ncbi:MAG TPA: CUAEP/CCAEP-tail radical SAM protein [Vicinamibacterales bacterium]|nr:CUAEP/CCAEP-tail radical SAM protein [Vicinamibacterales bacterium]